MKSYIRILLIFTIVLEFISCATNSAFEKGKGNLSSVKFFERDAEDIPSVGVHGGKYTFVFDITNESKEQVPFYVIRVDSNRLDSEGYAQPAVWQEISVPPETSGIYTYSVKKGTEDRCSFQWGVEYKGTYNYSSGSAKLGYGNGVSRIVVKEDFDTWMYRPGWDDYHMGHISTGSYTYIEREKKLDEGRRWIILNQRNPENNRVQESYKYITIYVNDDAEAVYQKLKSEEDNLIIDEYIIANTRGETRGIPLFDSEKKLVGKWEGSYNGLKATLTLNSDKFYRLDFEDGAWEQWWWNADLSYINLQIYTTKEIMTIPYTLKDNILSVGDLGEWKRVQ